MRTATVVNEHSTASGLTIGKEYSAKLDSKGAFRVLDDKGRWSKYGMDKFKIISDPDNTLMKMPGSYTVDTAASELMEKLISTPIYDAKVDYDKMTEAELIKEIVKDHPTMSAHAIADGISKAKSTVKAEKVEDKPMTTKLTVREFLQGQGVSTGLVDDMNAFRKFYALDDEVKERLVAPKDLFVGGEVWTAAITSVLSGQHILLQGGKATGKNTLTRCLSFFFGRPQWDTSFHVNMDASSLIGAETFKDNEVQFRPGAVYECAKYGGFGILDEINMAKNEAVSVLHSITDDRRVIDVPGYERIELHEACRFIGTMNYGYAGTRELNEALTSRFVVINVPELKDTGLLKLLSTKFPHANKDSLGMFVKMFTDLQTKAHNAEISTASVDLRGIIAGLKMVQMGMKPSKAMEYNIVNKCFDEFERKIVSDTVRLSISESMNFNSVFPKGKEMVVDFSAVR